MDPPLRWTQVSALARKRSEFGTLYRGRAGQWTWVFHRLSGIAIILFLFAHVVDTAVVAFGPEAYDRVMEAYHNPFVRALELGLVAAVLYHAINGVKIMVVDFWPSAALHNKALTRGMLVVFVLSMLPITYVMGKGILESF